MKQTAKIVAAVLIIIAIGTITGTVFSANVNRKPLTEKEIPVQPEKMSEYILNEMKADPFVKEHFGWKLAFCQHPMYLVIDEDRGEPSVCERIPPWGAPDSNEYVARVRRNLQALRDLPDVKLNYQWSAMELNTMAKTYPDVYQQLKDLYKAGSLDFVDGTYSQAHLHVFGAESNWRQFEYGQEVYKDLFNKNVDIYARQETSSHQQLPQILKLFGYKFMVFPFFPSIFEITQGPIEFECAADTTGEAIAGDEFIDAVSLDGSTIPVYFYSRDWHSTDDLHQDLYSGPKIFCVFPDLSEVSEKTLEKYGSLYDFVLLRSALIERHAAAQTRAKAKIYSYWSYTEGVWAEELARAIKQAEEHILLAEAIAAMKTQAGGKHTKAKKIKDIWLEILKSQHHDISWIEITDLRRKSINRLNDSISVSKKIMADLAQDLVQKDDSSHAVFNGYVRPRKCLVELDGNNALKAETKFQSFEGKTLGFVDAPAGGFKSFKTTSKMAASEQTQMPEQIKTDYYNVTLSPSGLIEQITAENGKNLLKPGDYLGGEMRARIDKQWYDNRKAETTYYTGPVCDIVKRSTSIGDIPVAERYYFFKNQPLIKAQITFDFGGNAVGYMWIDKTKINVYYPTAAADVYYDIPFGYIKAGRDKRPLYPTNWLYSGGLVYVNRGTPKHWTDDGLLANVIAWGSNHFTNRVQWWWLNHPRYDIRLYGKQTIEYYLIPFGDFDGNKITERVAKVTYPVFITKGGGEKSFYCLKDPKLVVTAIYEKQNQVWARGYQLPTNNKGRFHDWQIFNMPQAKLANLTLHCIQSDPNLLGD